VKVRIAHRDELAVFHPDDPSLEDTTPDELLALDREALAPAPGPLTPRQYLDDMEEMMAAIQMDIVDRRVLLTAMRTGLAMVLGHDRDGIPDPAIAK
jgi:hypothetical protein